MLVSVILDLAGAVLRVGIGVALFGTILAASGKMDDFVLGWYQIQQVLGG